jgi:signal transduction histidine kinase
MTNTDSIHPLASLPLDAIEALELTGKALLVPGSYSVTFEDGYFVSCSEEVRRLLNLPMVGPINLTIKTFYANSKDREDFLRDLLEEDEHGRVLARRIVHFVVNQEDKYLEIQGRIVRNPHTLEPWGHIACMVDITETHLKSQQRERLQQKIEELTRDLGTVTHALAGILIGAKKSFDACAETLGVREAEDIDAQTAKDFANQLPDQAIQLSRLLRKLANHERTQTLEEATHLTVLIDKLESAQKIIEHDFLAPVWRQIAHEASANLQRLKDTNLPRELLREVMRSAENLERTSCLVDLLNSRTAVIEVDAPLRALNDYINREARPDEQRTQVSANAIVVQVIKDLTEYARAAGIEIIFTKLDTDAIFTTRVRDVRRALTNILHNAIKYSWQSDRKSLRSRWVGIKVEKMRNAMVFSIQNLGVPIAKDEIETGDIFRVGYRGRLSGDKGRLGTGIGLSDAYQVAQSNGGAIVIDSHPVDTTLALDHSGYYAQPFLTTVRFSIAVI